MTATRRQLLGRGIGLAGAAALPGSLLAAAPAMAQEDDETDTLERIVIWSEPRSSPTPSPPKRRS